MSQSRAERRRSSRMGNVPPRKRDPMVPIYIGLAVVIILVFAGFGINNWIVNNNRQNTVALESHTPTPVPTATSKPIQLKDLVPIGTPTGFPQPNLRKGVLADTPSGGQGQKVDDIPCESTEQVALHIHSHLAIFVDGKQVQVPPYIGMSAANGAPCLYWIHTHGPDGILHVEAGDIEAPDGGPFTLGMFFDIWGEPLSNTQVGPFKGDVTGYVNGAPYMGDPRQIPLRSHQVITLEVGSPKVAPPNYLLPKND